MLILVDILGEDVTVVFWTDNYVTLWPVKDLDRVSSNYCKAIGRSIRQQ